jgi:heat shock protein HslJ
MKRIRLFEIIGAIVMLSLTAVACISSVGATNAEKLEGVTWVLKSYGDPNNLQEVVAGSEVTVTLDKDKKEIKGNGGVNLYGGKYETDGNKLTVSDLISTAMAGSEPLMNQEKEFFSILESAQSYKIEGQELTITGTQGVLVFKEK